MGLLVTLAGAAFAAAGTVQARGLAVGESLESVSLPSLPAQAQDVYRLILAGGPFPPRSKDGVVFGNRERILPRAPRGFYHEYTVPTPGADNRGARRIVCGGNPPTHPQACYYTADHYASFRMIVQ
jgi:ribonuclease T1